MNGIEETKAKKNICVARFVGLDQIRFKKMLTSYCIGVKILIRVSVKASVK